MCLVRVDSENLIQFQTWLQRCFVCFKVFRHFVLSNLLCDSLTPCSACPRITLHNTHTRIPRIAAVHEQTSGHAHKNRLSRSPVAAFFKTNESDVLYRHFNHFVCLNFISAFRDGRDRRQKIQEIFAHKQTMRILVR